MCLQETLESVLGTLLNQQRLLMEALDHTGEGTEEETDIHTVFRSLMQQISTHQEYLEKARGMSLTSDYKEVVLEGAR